MSLLLSLVLFVVPVSQATSKKPCNQMAKKICDSLGFDAFFCRTYVKVASHKDANQKHCDALLKNNWDTRLAALQRQESTMKQMKQISEGNPIRMQQFKQYQKNLGTQTINGMLKSGARTTTTISPKACRMLAGQACKDLGARSFYCSVFLAASKNKTSKASRCHVVLKNWNTSQLANYAKREKYMAIMITRARTRKQKLEVLQLRKNQTQQIFNYLSQ